MSYKLKVLLSTDIALFYFSRFSVIQNTGQACTCIATGLKSQSEYLVAVADTSIKCYAIGDYVYYHLFQKQY